MLVGSIGWREKKARQTRRSLAIRISQTSIRRSLAIKRSQTSILLSRAAYHKPMLIPQSCCQSHRGSKHKNRGMMDYVAAQESKNLFSVVLLMCSAMSV
jgi:hypothetical protein